jgi:hypothetical protein
MAILGEIWLNLGDRSRKNTCVQPLNEIESNVKWFLIWISMAFLQKTDRFSYFDKKFDWLWMTDGDRTIVFNL